MRDGASRPRLFLRLQGGELDGLKWSGAIDVGQRICCGKGLWMPSHVYVVTAEITPGPGGRAENIAVPAEF